MKPVLLLLLLLASTAAAANDNSNINNMIDSNNPKEKNATLYCTLEDLIQADISNNQFISRAEYVNLLLDLAPDHCSVIDSWLNDEPFQNVFEELSCLCQKYGGIDGDNNCCLQAVGVPMLASFAIPGSYYPIDYGYEACAKIDEVLRQVCTVTPTAPPTLFSSTASLSPSMQGTTDQTHGDGVEVIIQDGDVTVEDYREEGDDLTEEEIVSELDLDMTNSDPMDLEIQQEVQDLQEDEPTDQVTLAPTDTDMITMSDTTATPNTPTPTTDAPMPELPLAPDSTWTEGVVGIFGDSVPAATADPEVHNRERPLGIILAALLVVAFCLSMGMFVVWSRRRNLSGGTNKPENLTGGDEGNESVTPTRSNRRNNSFSSGEDSSTDEEDDPDIERPRVRMGAKGHVIRAEFQDDLSIWGRRKRRKQERQQRREERKQALLEQPQHLRNSNISNILTTLELDLTEGGIEAGIKPISSAKSKGEKGFSTPRDGIDIFDDTSETSSYDGSPAPHEPLETSVENSIENWLERVQTTGNRDSTTKSTNISSSLLDDQSVASRTSRLSTASSRRSSSVSPKKMLHTQRQPQDPVLKDWANQRQPSNPQSVSNYGVPPFPTKERSYPLNPSRSFSPARTTQAQVMPTASFSPTRGKALDPQTFNFLSSSASFSPASSPSRHSQSSLSVSPILSSVLWETLNHFKGSSSTKKDSTISRTNSNSSSSDPSAMPKVPLLDSTSILQLDLPVEQTHRPIRPAPRLSPESQEFYDSVLRIEPPDEEDEAHTGRAFAFETARRPERYLV